MKNEQDKKKYCVYRHFDFDGNLLYVGCSLNLITRIFGHKQKSFWFKDIDTIKLEHLDSKEMMIEVERTAIQTENPKYNKEFGTFPKQICPRIKADKERIKKQMLADPDYAARRIWRLQREKEQRKRKKVKS